MNPAYRFGQKLAEGPAADEPEGEHYRRNQALLGGAALAGGAYAGSKARPMITGRTRLYHGTTPENVSAIHAEGLKPSSIAGAKSVTNILPDDIRGAAQELGYMTPGHMGARGYAGQAIATRNGESALGRAAAVPKGWLNPFQEGVASADVPMWDPEVAAKVRPNPEARGSLEAYREGVQRMNPHEENVINRWTTRKAYEHHASIPAFHGGLDAKYFHGSPRYQGISLKEIGQYARQHPGRFAGGLGLAAAGTAAGAYGAKKLYDAWRGQSDAPPSAP